MIVEFKFVNNDGGFVDFNTDLIPLTGVTFEVQIRNNHRNKMQRHGLWPGYTYAGGMLIHTEGQIFGQTSEDYNVRKMNMINTIYPNPDIIPIDTGRPIDRRLGYLEIMFGGIADKFRGDVTLDGPISIPISADDGPARSSFQITWQVFTPYLVGLSTGKHMWVA